jgi:hypothetical protein
MRTERQSAEEAMTVHEAARAKIRLLPEPLAQEVNDFIDFLLAKAARAEGTKWVGVADALDTAESDISDYLRNLEQYEERLARGEIRW